MSAPRLDLLGKRVLMHSGVQGPVISVGIGGDIEVSNEREGGKCRYWFAASEVVEILEETPPAEATPARTKLESVLAEEWASSPVKDDVAVAHAYGVENVAPADRRLRAAVAVLGKRALAWSMDVCRCGDCRRNPNTGTLDVCSKHAEEWGRIVAAAKEIG